MVKKATSKQVSTAVVLTSIKKQMKLPIKRLGKVRRINNNNDNVIVADNLKVLATLYREVEAKHKAITGPLKEGIKKIDELFDDTYETIDDWRTWGKEEMRKFINKQRTKVKEVEQSFAKGKMSGVTLMKRQESLSVDMGSATARKVWTAIPTDESLTPREYMVPDEAKIKEALKAGKKVKGWKWEQVEQIAI